MVGDHWSPTWKKIHNFHVLLFGEHTFNCIASKSCSGSNRIRWRNNGGHLLLRLSSRLITILSLLAGRTLPIPIWGHFTRLSFLRTEICLKVRNFRFIVMAELEPRSLGL